MQQTRPCKRGFSVVMILALLVFSLGSGVAGRSGAMPAELGQVEYLGHVDGGVSNTIFAQGSIVYVSEGPRLSIFDVNNPANPVMVGQTNPLPAIAIDMEVRGSTAYIAYGGARAGLVTVDVSNPAQPAVLGNYEIPGQLDMNSIAVEGTVAYLTMPADTGAQLRTVDVSDPANPVPLGAYHTPYQAWKVFVAGNVAYVADNTSLLFLDVTDPANPTLLYTYTTIRTLDIQVVGDLAYLAGADGGIYDQGVLSILDVSDPTAPVEVGFYDAYPCGCSGIRVVGNRVYMTDFINAWLRIFDVSNPAAPVELGHYFGVGGYSSEVSIVGAIAYLADDWQGGMQVVDVSNPAAPYRIARYDRPGFTWEVAVENGLAYIGHGDGLSIVDVTDPRAPDPLGFYYAPAYVRDVVQSGSYAYISLDPYGVGVVDVSNPAAPVLRDSVSLGMDVKGVTQAGNMMYAVGWGDPSHVSVVDVTNPYNILPRGSVAVTGQGFFMDIDIEGDLVYAASGWLGQLYIVDVSNPDNPVIVGSYNEFAYGVDVVGDIAYVATGELAILDVSNPANPAVLGTLPVACNQVTVVGSLAYLASWYDGISVVDVSDPSAPLLLGTNQTGERATAIDAVGDTAYVADIDGGLYLFRYFDPAAYALDITKSGPGTAFAGEPITYTLAVANNGILPVTGVVITDVVPAGASYVRGGTLLPGGVVEWTLPELAPGQAEVQFVVTATQTITNSAYRVSCAEGVSATGTVPVVTVVIPPPGPDLGIRKAGPGTALPGETITYTLAFSNVGYVPATEVVVSDTIPAEMGDPVTISSNVAITMVPGTRYAWQVQGLGRQEGGIITISALLTRCLPAGTELFNTAAITAAEDADPANNQSAVTTTVLNARPLAGGDVYTAHQDTPLVVPAPGVLANDTDANCDALAAVLATPPSSGTLSLAADGSFVYTPTVGWHGVDSFIYRASDGALADTAVVTLTVTASNTAPLAYDDAYTTTMDTPLIVPLPGVLGNDVDLEGDPLTALLVEPPASGALGLNQDGSFVYVPAGGYSGTVTFTYQADDGIDLSNVALVAVGIVTTCEGVEIGGLSCTPLITTNPGACPVGFSAWLIGDWPFSYDWDFGPFGHSSEARPIVEFGYSGTYPFTLTASNCSGTYSDTATAEATVSCGSCIPVTQTSFTWTPATPTVGQPVTFSGQAEGSEPITFTWAMGDGSPPFTGGPGGAISYTFTQAGSYTVTLTTTNYCGVEVAASRVTVEEVESAYWIYLPLIEKGGGR